MKTQFSVIYRAAFLICCLAAATVKVPFARAAGIILTPADASRVEACRQAILSCQLADGAIPEVGYRLYNQPVFIDPYFAALACLGLLSAETYKSNPNDLPYIARWLDWGADHQAPNGTIPRFEGRRDQYGRLQPNPRITPPDSQDSALATQLTLAAGYVKASKIKPSAKLIDFCTKSFNMLERCLDANGFYWNFDPKDTPSGKVRAQYLLDQLEVAQGLFSAAEFFNTAGNKQLADLAQKRAKSLASKMGQFWYPEQSYFVCMYGDKAYKVAWNQQPVYAEGLATVSALAFFDNVSAKTRTDLWAKLMNTHGAQLDAGFSTQQFDLEDPTIERVYFASKKAAPAADQSALLSRLRQRTDEFIARNNQLSDPNSAGLKYPYVHRYGMLLQGLLAQTGDFPAELPKVPLAQ